MSEDVRWDEWWRNRLARDRADLFPMFEAPLIHHKGRWYDPANTDNLLVDTMAEHGLRTILCAGNGISQEPRALAAAGFSVTALDLSPTAMRMAEGFGLEPSKCEHFCRPEVLRVGGSVSFVVGDLLDPTVCPGPFDVIIERRTVQTFPERQRPTALEALTRRLGKVGIILSLCNDDQFPPELGWAFHESGLFHASESWFREQGWNIWDGAPGSTLPGRVVWLIRCGTMKPRPSDNRG